MAIERKCENCANTYCEYCIGENLYRDFIPKEELVRQDERNKILRQVIGLFKHDLEKFDLSSINVQDYIKGIIELLEEEQ